MSRLDREEYLHNISREQLQKVLQRHDLIAATNMFQCNSVILVLNPCRFVFAYSRDSNTKGS